MKISDVKIGYTFIHPRWGQGMIISKTVKTLTAQFEKGLKSKVTYKTKDSNFSPFDFS